MRKKILFILNIFIFLIGIESFAKSYISEDFLGIQNGIEIYSIYDKKTDSRGVATSDGKLIIPIEYSQIKRSIDNNIMAIDKDNQKRVFTSDGNLLIPPIYDDIQNLNGHFLIKKDGKYGLLTSENEIIFPVKYDSIVSKYYLNSKDYILKEGDKLTYSKNGENINIPYDNATFFAKHKNFIIVYKNNKIGLYNIEQNKFIIPAQYDKIDITNNIYAPFFIVEDSKSYGIYDSQGNIVYKPDLKALNDQGKFAVVQKNDDKYEIYYYDNENKIITEKEYIKFARVDDIYEISFYIKDKGKFGILKWNYGTMETKVTVPYIYDDILIQSRKYTLGKKGDKWYAINVKTGEINNNKVFDSVMPSKKYRNRYITTINVKEGAELGYYNLSTGEYTNKNILKSERKKDFIYDHPILSTVVYGPPAAVLIGVNVFINLCRNVPYQIAIKKAKKIKIKE